jgi:CBS domain containing-hemolysin-like protein
MTWTFILLIIAILIFINALYVAAEFSAVSSKHPRLKTLAEAGSHPAAALLAITEDPRKLDTYVATCQVGITLSSLVLGFYGQGQVYDALQPLLQQLDPPYAIALSSASAVVILIVLSVLQALLGELVPKNIGLQFPERLGMLTILPMTWSMQLFKPLIWLFNGSGTLIMRLLRLDTVSEHSHVHDPEEIAMLVSESGAGGRLDLQEELLLKNTLQLRDLNVSDMMVPREKILAVPQHLTLQEMLRVVAGSPHSRLPLYNESIDNIVGMVHLRDLLCSNGSKNITRNITRPVPFLQRDNLAVDALATMRRQNAQIAIVKDESGRTIGLVTIEDILESIFGDLQDEFDVRVSRPQK